MSASLRAMMEGVIDYAGMFPPAKLSLEDAIRNYARYRQDAEAWMLGRFICPSGRLADLKPFQNELFQTGRPFAFSILGRGGDTGEDFLKNLLGDLEAIDGFRKTHGTRVVVDAYEVKLPAELVCQKQPDEVRDFVGAADTMIDKRRAANLTPYYEANLGDDWKATLSAVVGGVAAASESRESCGPPAFKFRCGGEQPAAFPTSEQVAYALVECRDTWVQMKFTAGLHHPLRHFNKGQRVTMHGFLNVFAAGVLAHVLRIDEAQVRTIIEDEDPTHFVFDDEGFRWKDLKATTRQIMWSRQMAVTSFGSCSFDEPREDLRALRLLA